MLDERELKYLSNDSVEADTVIKDQMPKPGAMVKVNTTILLYAQEQSPEDSSIDQEVTEGKVVVPDLKGKSIREANNILVSLGLKLRIEGSGVAVSQDPPAHSQVEPGTEIMVEFTMPGQ